MIDRWMNGVTRYDKTRNATYVRESEDVVSIVDKIKRNGLRIVGHVMMRETSEALRTIMKINVKRKRSGRIPLSV